MDLRGNREMKNKFYAAIALIFMTSITSVNASQLDELISNCLSTMDSDIPTAEKYADDIIKIGKISDIQNRLDAKKCIKKVKGDEWNYSISLGRFVTPEQIQEAKDRENRKMQLSFAKDDLEKTIEKALETFNADNLNLIQRETFKACASLYERDQEAALLISNCQTAFRSVQHPKMPSIRTYVTDFIKATYPNPSRDEQIVIKELGWGEAIE